jgi:transcriptional regulator
VHAYGRPRPIGEDGALRDLLRRTARRFEAEAGSGEDGRPPWRMEDLAEDFLAAMTKGVVGFEIEISRLEGKFKLGQNRSAEDQARVAAELARIADPSARGTAALMSNGKADPGPKDPA